MTPECRKCAVREAPQRLPLLDNSSLNTFPIIRQRLAKHFSAATVKHIIIKELLGMVISIRFSPKIKKEDM
jgi:hypothetical protein